MSVFVQKLGKVVVVRLASDVKWNEQRGAIVYSDRGSFLEEKRSR